MAASPATGSREHMKCKLFSFTSSFCTKETVLVVKTEGQKDLLIG